MKLRIYSLYVGDTITYRANPGGAVATWVVSANTWPVTCFWFLSVAILCLGSWACLLPPPVARFDNLYVKITSFRATLCLLRLALTLLPFRDEIFQPPYFWGVNGRFQAKRAEYSNLCIIKTTAVIPTVLYIARQVLFTGDLKIRPINKSKMEDGRHLEKKR